MADYGRITSRDLFSRFVKEELHKKGVRFPAHLARDRVVDDSDDFKLAMAALSELAIVFNNSQQRDLVKQSAMSSSVNIGRDSIVIILRTLLGPEKTDNLSERIIVVFVYCCDLLLRVHQNGEQRLAQVFQWCRDSISTLLDPVIFDAGGWVKVLHADKPKSIFQAIWYSVVAFNGWIFNYVRSYWNF